MKNCGYGYKGDCCCECEHRLKIHICGCGKCSDVKGWICKVFWEIDKTFRQVSHSKIEHGCCELYKKRELEIKNEIISRNKKSHTRCN